MNDVQTVQQKIAAIEALTAQMAELNTQREAIARAVFTYGRKIPMRYSPSPLVVEAYDGYDDTVRLRMQDGSEDVWGLQTLIDNIDIARFPNE